MSAQAKPKHRTISWKEYNAALKARGSLLIWLDKGMCWHGSASGKRGRSAKYDEAAIEIQAARKIPSAGLREERHLGHGDPNAALPPHDHSAAKDEVMSWGSVLLTLVVGCGPT